MNNKKYLICFKPRVGPKPNILKIPLKSGTPKARRKIEQIRRKAWIGLRYAKNT